MNRKKKVAMVEPVENKKPDLEKKIHEIIKDKFREYHYDVDVVCYKVIKECVIHCQKSGADREGQLICFDIMLFLYEKLGSKKINTSNIEFNDGCDTCGHGSQTKVTITIDEVDFTKIK